MANNGHFRVDKKQAAGVVTGSLFMFANSMKLGEFTSKATTRLRGYGSFANNVAYFVGGEKRKGAGGGRLSKGLAMFAATWVSAAIRGDHTKYTGPTLDTEYSKDYGAWKRSIPKYANLPILNLTGALADSITVIGDKGVGISSRATTLNPWNNKIVKVYQYAMAHEYGTTGHMPQRPIISGAIVSWLQSVDGFKTFAEATRKMLVRSHWDVVQNPELLNDVMGKSERLEDTDYGDGQAISSDLNIKNVLQHEAAHTLRAKKQLEKAGDALQDIADGIASGDVKPSNHVSQSLYKYFSEVSALTPKQKQACVDTILTGRVPKISDLF